MPYRPDRHPILSFPCGSISAGVYAVRREFFQWQPVHPRAADRPGGRRSSAYSYSCSSFSPPSHSRATSALHRPRQQHRYTSRSSRSTTSTVNCPSGRTSMRNRPGAHRCLLRTSNAAWRMPARLPRSSRSPGTLSERRLRNPGCCWTNPPCCSSTASQTTARR